MKKIFCILVIVILSNMAVGQTLREKILNADSTYVALQNVVRVIYKQYSINDQNYNVMIPDSVNKILEITLSKMEDRRLQFEMMSLPNVDLDKDQQTNNRNFLIDSLIKLNTINLNGKIGVSFGLSSNQGFVGGQYAFYVSNFRKLDVGLGGGIEYVNRGTGLVSLVQSTAFLTNNFFVSRTSFLNFDYGFTIPLSATYTNKNDEKVDYTDNELKSNYFLNIGLGTYYSPTSSIQFNIRNQSLGVPEPLNQRVWMFGLKLSF